MSRSLTASDRKNLVRLASELPQGSPERKAILAGLRQSSKINWSHRAIQMAEKTGKRLVENPDTKGNLYKFFDGVSGLIEAMNSEPAFRGNRDLERAFASAKKAEEEFRQALNRSFLWD